MALNVIGGTLETCSTDPLTGFLRDGCCQNSTADPGMHLICAIMTDEFLHFSLSMGNNLMVAVPSAHFPGLKAGDRWCLCLARWQEAYEAGCAPPVVLAATHISVTEFVDRDVLLENTSR